MVPTSVINRRAVLAPHNGSIRCGWVLEFSENGLVFELSHGVQLNVGEGIDVTIANPNETVKLTGVVVESENGRAVILPSEEAKSESSTQEFRTRVHLIESVQTESGLFPVEVVDISPNGIGLLANVVVVNGAEIRLHFDSTGEPIRLDCAVRYCKPEGDRYRIGLEIIGADAKGRRCWEALNLPQRNMEFAQDSAGSIAS